MRKVIAGISLIILLPYVSGANADCPATKKPGRLTRSPIKICPPLIPLVDQVKSFQGSLLGLTAAVNKLATATEDEAKGQSKSALSQPLSKDLFDNGGWLTMMAIIIALSAYMAALRLSLIDKSGRATRRKKLIMDNIKRLEWQEWRVIQLTAERAKLDKLQTEIIKYQEVIRRISFVDFILGVSLVSTIIRLFGPHLCPPQFSAVYIAIVSFVLAVAVFIYLHVREWIKTIGKAYKLWAEK